MDILAPFVPTHLNGGLPCTVMPRPGPSDTPAFGQPSMAIPYPQWEQNPRSGNWHDTPSYFGRPHVESNPVTPWFEERNLTPQQFESTPPSLPRVKLFTPSPLPQYERDELVVNRFDHGTVYKGAGHAHFTTVRGTAHHTVEVPGMCLGDSLKLRTKISDDGNFDESTFVHGRRKYTLPY